MKNSLRIPPKVFPMSHAALLAVTLAVAFSPLATASRLDADAKPATIDKVVEFLGKMLSKSKAEGEAETEIYAKFKCYCDDNEKAKTAEVKESTESILKLESQIQGLQSANGELSTQCAKLKSEIAENSASQKEAEEIRSKASKDYKAEEEDLKKAIGQMSDAIDTLFSVGADQTKSSGADHAKFMAGYKKKSSSFLGLGVHLQYALEAASALLPPEKQNAVNAFLQAPFTGSYSSQSAGVMGILKMMRGTFESNLQAASEAEKRDAKAHVALMENLEKFGKEMSKAYDEKQEELGEKDTELGAKRLQLKSATEAKDSAEDFLSKLLPTCETKTKEFNARKELRANEEASIAEAVRILTSDPSLKAFVQTGKDEGSFLQLRADRRGAHHNIRLEVQRLLDQAMHRQQAMHHQADGKLIRLRELVQANNPFSVVFKEIEQMQELIGKEQAADDEKHKFCKDETNKSDKKLKETQDDIDGTEKAINQLEDTVDKPQTGLKAQEAALEKAMEENQANQKKETTMRQQENVQYQKNVAELDKAEKLLVKAMDILKKFYSSLNEKSGVASSLVQDQADPNPPETWKGAYAGQRDDGQGKEGAIGMLEFILSETKKQNTEAHKDESEAQADFEDSMAKATQDEKEQAKNMVKLKSALAKAEQEMIDKKQELKQAKKDKEAVEKYLADIKPGCDFMFDNYDLRTKNRELETKSLVQARTLLKSSPAYQAVSAEAEAKALGACKSKCDVPDHVKCKACLADVSIPGYCAGHSGTLGC